ncbi:MAG: DUF512 domain-containing protein [Clostridia bacterium]|nr:DUF512 domain-containing protein [Clostridia bacterium]
MIYTLFKTNILPVTSLCNTACIFCSHKQNPKEVEVFQLPKLTLDDYEEMIGFLSPNKKIVIGESATRIIEGEPFANKDFMPILKIIRKKFKNTPVQITTNGILLNEEVVKELVELQNIELNVSVNAVNPSLRKKILGIQGSQNIEEKILLLKNRIKFSGSLVWVPELMEYKDVEEVIALLAENEGEHVRVFLPGVTASGNKLNMELRHIYKDMEAFAVQMREKYKFPVIVEPSYISSLDCKVDGVIRNSPAYTAGIETGDIIKSVNGMQPSTRVDGFNRAYAQKDPVLTLLRQDRLIEVKLEKKKNTSPGFVVLYDVDPDLALLIKDTVKRYNAGKVLFVTSDLAFEMIQSFLRASLFDFEYDVLKAENLFFGGTIRCAGLLTVKDILKAVEEFLQCAARPDLILLPPAMFDHHNRDLIGDSIHEIEKRFGVTVDTL